MAKKAAIAEISRPTKGVRPNLAGVPGELVDLDGLSLEFGGRNKISPYDALLHQLAKATDEALAASKPRPGLKFGDPRAKASLWNRAKKLGLRISFAFSSDELYVRMDGRVDDNLRETRRSAIKKLLANGQAWTYLQIAARLREGGDASVDAQTVDAIMVQLMRTGDVIRQDGGAWKIAPARKAS